MFWRSAILLTVTAVATLFAGCRKKDAPHPPTPSTPDNDRIVVIVNDSPLTWADMEKRAMGFMKDDIETNHLIIPSNRVEEAKEHFRKRSINAFVYKTLMLEEATRNNLRINERDRLLGMQQLTRTLQQRNWTTNDFFQRGPMDEATMYKEYEDGLLIDKLLRGKVRSKVSIEKEEVEALSTQIDATNRMVRARIEDLRKQLLDGADFAELAKTHSVEPNAPKGGEMTDITRGKLPRPLEDAIFTQEIGTIGPVIESVQGYHIVKVNSRTPAKSAADNQPAQPESASFSQIMLKPIIVDRKKINSTLIKRKYDHEHEKFFNELKANAKIECLLYPDMFASGQTKTE